MKIRDRIRELRRVKASELAPNSRNWRTHPRKQQDALRGVLAEVGWADAVLAYEREDGALELIDGHLRAETAGDEMVPVLVLDVDATEAAKILATHDPLAAMAETDPAALAALLEEIDTESAALQQMLDELGTPSESEEQSGDAVESDPHESAYKEQFGVIVVCENELDQQRAYDDLVGRGYNCRVVVT
jgi:hypothetical protein